MSVCLYKRWAQGFEERAKSKWKLGKDKKEEKIVGVVKMGVCFLDEEFVKDLTF